MGTWRTRIFQLILPGLVVLLLVYTGWQILNGERGIFTWRLVSKQVEQLRRDNAALQAEVDGVEQRVKLLRPPANEDYMDELVRRSLPVGQAGEKVILVSPSGYGGSGTLPADLAP